MYGSILQDWITIRGASTILTVTQSEQSWLSFQTSEDIVLILDCRETSGTIASITINFETAPTKDEILFLPMQTGLNMATAPGTPQVQKVIAATGPTVPLSRWVRWRIVVGTPTSAWDCTFRVMCSTSGPVG